jgi:hypothetical protein
MCEKAVIYLWNKGIDSNTQELPENLDGASNVTIQAWYGSEFDMNEYHAILCDECLDKAIQSKRISFVKEHSPFG